MEVGKSSKNVVAVKEYMINKGAPQPGKTDGGALFNLSKGQIQCFIIQKCLAVPHRKSYYLCIEKLPQAVFAHFEP